MSIGKKLKKIREDKGLSVGEVAKDLGLTRQAIYNYETDTRVPRDEIKYEISEYYGLSVGDIFFDKKSNNKLQNIK